MAEITVGVVGNVQGGGGGSSPSPEGTSSEQNRIVEDFRKFARERGAIIVPGTANANQLYRDFGNMQKDETTQRIQQKYEERRDRLWGESDERHWAVEQKAEAEKARLIGVYGNEQAALDSNEWKRFYRTKIAPEHDAIDAEINERESELNSQEKDELKTALNELTRVLRESKEHAERSAERGDSGYLGQLRAERREILQQRESAATEEETMAASKRLSEVDEKIARATGSGGKTHSTWDRFASGTQGLQQTFSGLQGGDIGSAVMGIGNSIAGFSGMSMGSAMKMMGWVGAAVGAIKAIGDSNERYNSLANIAQYRSTSGGYQGKNSMMGISTALRDSQYLGMQYTDLGFNTDEFANRATQVVQNRGQGTGWYKETMRQIGLEKSLALGEGSLLQGSQFDIYGQSVTDAVSKLISGLSTYKVEGANYGDLSRFKEKYDFQQALMQNYKSRSDKPDFDVANSAVLSMNRVKGITHDERDVTDYQQMQQAIQSPMNDRMKSLLYSTVSEMMPEMKGTDGKNYSASDAGRMDLIERAIHNPENEGKIMQATIQKITEMYGGIDTQMGYYAFKALFPNMSDDRRDAYVKAFSDPNSEEAKMLKGGAEKFFTSEKNQPAFERTSENLVKNAKGYQHGMTRTISHISTSLDRLVDLAAGNSNWGNNREAVEAATGD